jgi:hypothetical protein
MDDKEFYDRLEIAEQEMDVLIKNWEKEITSDPMKGQMCAWAAFIYIARLALPVIRIFRYHNKAGLPGDFYKKEEGYDGYMEWNKVLHKIMIALTCLAYQHSKNEDDQKKLSDLYKKYLGTENPGSVEKNQFFGNICK